MSGDALVKGKLRVEKLIYPKYSNAQVEGEWGIVACEVVEELMGRMPVNSFGNVSVKGTLPKIQLGEEYLVVGKIVEDARYGLQVDAIFFSMVFDFENVEDSNTFLRMILTEAQYNTLTQYHENPCQLLRSKDVETLTQIPGIGVKTAVKLISKFETMQDFSKAYIELGKLGLSQNWIIKLLEAYGSPDVVVAKITKNPYLLIEEVEGIGWAKADELALKNGMTLDSPERLKAFILHYLKEESNKGNSWVEPWKIVEALEEKCGEVEFETRTKIFTELKEEEKIWFDADKTKVALALMLRLERNIAEELQRLLEADNHYEYSHFEEIIKKQEQEQGWEFTDEQLEAIQGTLDKNVVIITGSAGTGKSSVVSAVVKILDEYSFAQTALAGRAADRLKEITGSEGYTIHRLLGYDPRGGFAYNEYDPLPLDIIILDEVSMVGGSLFLSLIRAIQSGSKLIMLGDMNQLEAIGTMNLLADMMNSGVVPTYRLNKIHRQAAKSAIITDSLKVAESTQIVAKTDVGVEIRGELQDLMLDLYDDKSYTAMRIKHHFETELKRLKDITKLQVIVPMRTNGDSSVFALNQQLQKIYNPHSNFGITVSPNSDYSYQINEGDKVIIRKNNYNDVVDENGKKVAVFNGNIGMVLEIDFLTESVLIELITGERVILPKRILKSVELAYAITCHSFQGSSADTVIVGLDFSAYTLLTKEWVYTAMTRAEKKCIMCVQTSALRYATANTNVPFKQTFLRGMLKGEKYE